MSMTPSSIRIAWSQSDFKLSMACVTRMIVRPSVRSCWRVSLHFRLNEASPTASTSSISITSASDSISMENASRICMPLE